MPSSTTIRIITAFLFLLRLASADIFLEAVSDSSCGSDGGSVLANVQQNTAAPFQSSGCVATGAYQSVKITNADAGFVCNLFSDPACQNFIQAVSGPVKVGTVCRPVIGAGVICFAQPLFDNPFALSTAEITVGQNSVLGSQGTFDGPQSMDNVITQAVNKGCTANGCSPTDAFTLDFDVATCNFLIGCDKKKTMSVAVTGNFDNADQRDYMSALLRAVFVKGATVVNDPNIFSNNGDSLVKVVSFAQVVINDQQGNNQAEMTITISINDNENGEFDCSGVIGSLSAGFLGAIPAVGSIIAGGFSAACAGATG